MQIFSLLQPYHLVSTNTIAHIGNLLSTIGVHMSVKVYSRLSLLLFARLPFFQLFVAS